MSASFRSHFRDPIPHREPIQQPQRKDSARLPDNSSTSEGKSKAAQHVSKLAERASRSFTPSERTEHDTKTLGREPTPTTSTRSASGLARSHSAAPRPGNSQLIKEAGSLQGRQRILSPPIMRTPSLVSGSSVSTFDSPMSAVGLRRKPSSIDRYASQRTAATEPLGLGRATMHSRNENIQEAVDDAVFGMTVPPTSANIAKEAFSPSQVGTAHRHNREWHATEDAAAPALPYAPSTTPSTRYSDSPFSHVPTPSTAPSWSPGLLTTSGDTPKPTQPSPSRNRTTGIRQRNAQADNSRLGLPSVRESSTSSSSNSTIKPMNYRSVPARKEVPRKKSAAQPATKSYAEPTTSSRSKQPPKLEPKVQPRVQVPPELAHLNVDPPLAASLQKSFPPIRPSRENTPTIPGMSRTAPVVQSDLPRLYTTYHKRTPSQETPVSPSAPSPGFKARFGFSPRRSSQQASPRVDSAISPPPSARLFARGPTPEVAPAESSQLRRKDSPAIGVAPSPSKSPRFGIFSRKSKAEPPKKLEKPRRQATKGPAAGTGHEGYGRFGFRGRSGSTTSSNGFRSPSTDSNSSNAAPRQIVNRKSSLASSNDESGLDDFLRERQEPRIIRGSGSTYSATASTAGSQPVNVTDPSSSSSLDSYPKPQLLPSAMGHDHGASPTQRASFSRYPPDESSEDDVNARYPTLAARRSFNRLSQAAGTSSVRLPTPIDTTRVPAKQSIDSYDADRSAGPRTDGTLQRGDVPFEGREGLWLRSQQPVLQKPARKWNFFQRAQASPRPKGKARAASPGDRNDGMNQQGPHRNAAHYAMLDPVESVDLYEVQQLVQESETSLDDSASDRRSRTSMVPYEGRHASLLPSPRKLEYGSDSDFRAKPTPPRIIVRNDSSELQEYWQARMAVPQPLAHIVDIPRSPSVPSTALAQRSTPVPSEFRTPEMDNQSFETPERLSQDNSPRQPRLSPIGRIPRIVSKRDREYKLPNTSFSRPFARAPSQNVKPPGALYNSIRSSRELTSPIEPGSQPVSSTSTRSDVVAGDHKSSIATNAPSVSTNRTSMDVHAADSFLISAPRKGSDGSYTSSSGNGSWYAAIAAAPQQDDPWAEYDDLMDDMLPPQRTPLSAGSSLGVPFQYANAMYNPRSPSLPTPLHVPQPPSTKLPEPPRSNTVPAVLSVPQQISRFMQPSLSPLVTQATLSGILEHYGEDSPSALTTPNRASFAHSATTNFPQLRRTSVQDARASMASSRYSRASGHSRSASLPENNVRNSQSSLTPSARFNRDTQLLDIAEDDGDKQTAQANLRFAALMTSKWLSFGRVLFSPAHHEMRFSDEPRVLVIDGLGSDWSYYVALTYGHAKVYNLGTAASNGSTSWPGITQKPPSNHWHIPHPAISSPFPFPKGFFTAVVFRFPNATTDQAYYACVSECKRVLRPGGYLEIAVLDPDLMNMGTRARSVVRGLKTRMQQHDQSVSLRNLSDFMVRLIGRRGFEEIQRCIVGVPAAGRIPRSQDISSISSGHSGISRPAKRRPSDHRQNTAEFSFADLLDDSRNTGPPNDEGITKMVAKVGRWWYSTCYETGLDQDRSIWADQALIRECEKQGTSFRLLICHAQKPHQTRRRTVSV